MMCGKTKKKSKNIVHTLLLLPTFLREGGVSSVCNEEKEIINQITYYRVIANKNICNWCFTYSYTR